MAVTDVIDGALANLALIDDGTLTTGGAAFTSGPIVTLSSDARAIGQVRARPALIVLWTTDAEDAQASSAEHYRQLSLLVLGYLDISNKDVPARQQIESYLGDVKFALTSRARPVVTGNICWCQLGGYAYQCNYIGADLIGHASESVQGFAARFTADYSYPSDTES